MAIAQGSAATWADMLALYNTLRSLQSQKGVTQTAIPSSTAGTKILVSDANTLRTAISGLSPTVALPAAAAQGSLITASYINGLKNSLNSVPTIQWLFKAGTGSVSGNTWTGYGVTWTGWKDRDSTAAGWGAYPEGDYVVSTSYLKGRSETEWYSETQYLYANGGCTSSAVNFTGYSKLYFTRSGAGTISIAGVNLTNTDRNEGTYYINVASVTGNHTVSIVGPSGGWITVTQMWLE